MNRSPGSFISSCFLDPVAALGHRDRRSADDSFSLLRSPSSIPSSPISQPLVSVRRSYRAPWNPAMSDLDLQVGAVITLTDGREATIRFLGATEFSEGRWVGIELTDATGKNDGEVKGVRYFACEPGFGMFVRPSAIAAILEPSTARESKQRPRTNTTTSTRQSGISAGLKKPAGIPPTAARRQTTNVSTPTPATKSAPRVSLRVCLCSFFSSALYSQGVAAI